MTAAQSAAELAAMDQASELFDKVLTPVILPGFRAIPPQLRQAWWDGFLSSCVGAMGATIGEKATQECCTDLYARALDFAADQAKAHAASGKAIAQGAKG